MSKTVLMQKHIRRYVLLILFAFLIVQTQAQKKGYSQGYIINTEGETVEGWIKDRSTGTFLDLYKQIRFKPDDALIKRKYSPAEIQGYGFNDQHYESLPLQEESAFFKFRYYLDDSYDRVFLRIVSGNENLTYYHWEYVDGESNHLDYIPLFHRSGSNEMVRVTQGILGLKRNRLVEYFWDCPELVRAIETKELKEIHEVYNFYLEHCARAKR